MSTGPLNSPGVRIIIIDQTISITPAGSPVEVEPFRTPIRGTIPAPVPDPEMEAEWEVDPQLFAEWEVDLTVWWEVVPDPIV